MERARQGRTHAFVNEGSRPYVGKGVIQRIIDVAPDEPAPRRGAAMQDPALADTGADPHRAATRPCPRVWATGARTPQPNLPDAPGSVSTVADSLMFDDKTCRHATYQRRSPGRRNGRAIGRWRIAAVMTGRFSRPSARSPSRKPGPHA
ncbi:hypothetical protein JCM18899A_07120 [Nocardioides sp. AN3]